MKALSAGRDRFGGVGRWLLLAMFALGCPSAMAEESATAESDSEPQESARSLGWVDEARLVAAGEAEPGSWLAHGQTYDELRFSTLTQINRDTVGLLGLAWVKNLNIAHRLQATPLVIDGVMYFTDSWSVAYPTNKPYAITGAPRAVRASRTRSSGQDPVR